MKRRMFIGGALLGLLCLVGCDAILESIYPAFKGGESRGIKATLNLQDDLLAYNDGSMSGTFGSNDYPVCLALVPFLEGPEHCEPDWSQADVRELYHDDFTDNGGKYEYAATFMPLAEGRNYKVLAWLDVDHSGAAGFDPDAPRPGIIMQTGEQEYTLDLTYWTPATPLIEVSGILSYISTPDWSKLEAGNEDSPFALFGPDYFDRAFPSDSFTVTLKPASELIDDIEAISFSVLKTDRSEVSYGGSTGFHDAAFSGAGDRATFVVEGGSIDTPLNDPGWDGCSAMVIRVKAEFENGRTLQGEVPIELRDSGSAAGSYYDFEVSLRLSSQVPYGVAQVYVRQDDPYLQLAGAFSNLDENGYHAFVFNDLYDPPGIDQYLEIFANESVSAALHYFKFYLSGDLYGEQVFNVDEPGDLAAVSVGYLYDVSVSVDLPDSYAGWHAYAVVKDLADASVWKENRSGDLDLSGDRGLLLPDIVDTTGSDQSLEVYLFDPAWQSCYRYSQDLTGLHSTTCAVSLAEGDFSPD